MTSKSKPVIPEHILASSSCPLGESDERIGLALADISACDKGSNPAQVIGVSHDEGIPRKARIPISRLSTAPRRVSTNTSDTELPAWHTRWSQRNQVGTTKEPNDGRPGTDACHVTQFCACSPPFSCNTRQSARDRWDKIDSSWARDACADSRQGEAAGAAGESSKP